MLVKTLHRWVCNRMKQDAGSTLVTVLIIMLVLSVGGLALAAVVTSSTVTLSDSSDRARSQAAVDAGIATVVARMEKGDFACGTTAHDYSENNVRVNGTASPSFDFTLSCENGTAIIVTTAVVNGAESTRRAQFTYPLATGSSGGGSGLIFYGTGNVHFYPGTNAGNASSPVDILIPEGSFTCAGNVYGNLVVKGNVTTSSGCTIYGDVTSVTGTITMNGTETIKGSVKTGGTGTNTVRGTIEKNLHTVGPISFGWNSTKVLGTATSGGNVSLGNMRIEQSLTLPSGRTLNMQSGSYGSLMRPATVTAPTMPTLPAWFDYDYRASDWPGYTVVTLKNSGSGTGTCNDWNTYGGNGWYSLNSQTGPTVVDARACAELSVNHGDRNPGTTPLAITHNTVLLAKSFDLTNSVFQAGAGAGTTTDTKPKLYFVTEDTTANAQPNCANKKDVVKLNGVRIASTIKAMAYTPCSISMSGGSIPWHGTIYAGEFDQGGSQQFEFECIVLPRMPDCAQIMPGGGGGVDESVPRRLTLTLTSTRDVAAAP